MSLALPTVLLFSAGVTALFGWVVYGGDTSLIAGYDPERVDDEDGLARFVGRGTLFIAGCTAAFGVLTLFVTPGLFTVVVYTGLVVLVSLWLVVGARRFEKRGA